MNFTASPVPAVVPPAGTLAHRLVMDMDEHDRLDRPSMWRWFHPNQLVCPGDLNVPWFVVNTDGLLFPHVAAEFNRGMGARYFGSFDVVELENWDQAVGFYAAYYHARRRRLELEAEPLDPAPPPVYVAPQGSPAPTYLAPSTSGMAQIPAEVANGSPPAEVASNSAAEGTRVSSPPAHGSSPVGTSSSLVPASSSPPLLRLFPAPSSSSSPVPFWQLPDGYLSEISLLDEGAVARMAPSNWEADIETMREELAARREERAAAGSSTGPGTQVYHDLFAAGSAMDVDTDDDDSDYIDDGDSSDGDSEDDDDDDDDEPLIISTRKGKQRARSSSSNEAVKRRKLNSSAATRIIRRDAPYVTIEDSESEETSDEDNIEDTDEQLANDEDNLEDGDEQLASDEDLPAVSELASPSSDTQMTHLSPTPSPSPPHNARAFVPLFPDSDHLEDGDEGSRTSLESEEPTFRYLDTDMDGPFEPILNLPLTPPASHLTPPNDPGPSSAPLPESSDQSGLVWEVYTPAQEREIGEILDAIHRRHIEEAVKLD